MQVRASKTKMLQIRVKQTEFDALKQFAKDNNTTMSKVARRAIALYLRGEEE